MSTDENTKEKIIEVAIECFGEYGYDGTSMRMIAEKSGVSKPAIYYYFPDKEHLFEGIFNYIMEKFMTNLRNISNSEKNAKEKLKDILLYRFIPIKKSSMIKRFASRIFMSESKNIVKLDHKSLFQKQEKIIIKIIQQGIDEGIFRPDIDKKLFLYSLIGISNIITRNHIMNNEKTIDEDIVEKIFEQLLKGVGLNKNK